MNKTNQINQINSFRLSRSQTKRTAEYHSRLHDARRFPFDEDTGGMSEALASKGYLEHHHHSDGNTPKTRQPLNREKDGASDVQ